MNMPMSNFKKNLYVLVLVLLSLTILSTPALAVDHYAASVSTTALTIQQPASSARRIVFGDNANNIPGVSVYCAGAQTATLKWNGTAATATAGAEVKLPGTANASNVTVWTASNVGSGTTGPVYNIAAGETKYIWDANWIVLRDATTATNFTVATSGACTITFLYSAS